MLVFQFQSDEYTIDESDGPVRIILFLTSGKNSEFAVCATVSTRDETAIGISKLPLSTVLLLTSFPVISLINCLYRLKLMLSTI